MQIEAEAQAVCTPLQLDGLEAYERAERVGKGDVLFREGQDPQGVYVLRSGQVDLVFAAKTGQAKPLRVAEAGQILGLSCIVSRKPHDCTATARSSATVGFIEKTTFQRLLEEQPTLWFKVLQYISAEVNACWDCMRALGGTR